MSIRKRLGKIIWLPARQNCLRVPAKCCCRCLPGEIKQKQKNNYWLAREWAGGLTTRQACLSLAVSWPLARLMDRLCTLPACLVRCRLVCLSLATFAYFSFMQMPIEVFPYLNCAIHGNGARLCAVNEIALITCNFIAHIEDRESLQTIDDRRWWLSTDLTCCAFFSLRCVAWLTIARHFWQMLLTTKLQPPTLLRPLSQVRA